MSCKNGYKGILCNVCEDNYVKMGLYTCGKCENIYLIIIKFTFKVVIQTLIVIYLTLSNT